MRKLTDLEQRLIRIERVLNNESMLELLGQVEQMQAETRDLRGEIETLQHDVETAGARQRELYLDVDRRLQGLETGAAATAATAGGAAVAGGAVAASTQPAPTTPGSDRGTYQEAFELLKEGRYDEAAAGFQQFLASYPDSGLADNAQYWLAETYYVTRSFDNALPAFRSVIDEYPQSRKIPDAMLKVGYCHYELGSWSDARAALSRVTQDFPDTTAARLAGQRLARMDNEGN